MLTTAVLLMTLHTLRLLYWHPAGSLAATVVLVLFFALPIAVCLPGAWQGRFREHMLLAFLCLVYFMHAVLAAFQPQTALFGWLAAAAATALFIAVLWWMRAARN